MIHMTKVSIRVSQKGGGLQEAPGIVRVKKDGFHNP